MWRYKLMRRKVAHYHVTLYCQEENRFLILIILVHLTNHTSHNYGKARVAPDHVVGIHCIISLLDCVLFLKNANIHLLFIILYHII